MKSCCLFLCWVLAISPAWSFPEINNASFEDVVFTTFPGYFGGNGGVVSGWQVVDPTNVNGQTTLNYGVWHEDNGAWANNGMVPDGYQYFFFQQQGHNKGQLSQVVPGFRKGRKYKLSYRYNVRFFPDQLGALYPTAAPKANIEVRINGVLVHTVTDTYAVEPPGYHTKPWHEGLTAEFEAPEDGSYTLMVTTAVGTATVADVSPIFDDFRFIQTNPDPNTPPIVSPVENQRAKPGSELRIPILASDTNEPPQSLSYALEGPVPPGMLMDGNEVVFLPDPATGPAEFPVTVVVTDDGIPAKSTSVSFQLYYAGVKIESITRNPDSVTLRWIANPQSTYRIEQKSDLNLPTWEELPIEILADEELEVIDLPASPENSPRFYRVKMVY